MRLRHAATFALSPDFPKCLEGRYLRIVDGDNMPTLQHTIEEIVDLRAPFLFSCATPESEEAMNKFIGRFTEASRLAEFEKALDDSLKKTPAAPGNVANLASKQLKAMDKQIATDAFVGFAAVISEHTDSEVEVCKDHSHVPQAIDEYGSPWLIGARAHKVLTGCRSVPLSGLGHVLKVMSGDFFISCISPHACEQHNSMGENLLSVIDGRHYSALVKKQWIHDCVLKVAGGEEKDTMLFVPPGWWPNICAMTVPENRFSATLFAQPYLNANLLVQSFGILGESSRQSYKAAWANVEPVLRSKAHVISAGVKSFLDSIVSAADQDRAKLEMKNEEASKLEKEVGTEETVEG